MKTKKRKSLWQTILAVFVTLLFMITELMPVTVRAEASDTEKTYAAVYDYDYYKSHNVDLQKVFGNERQSYIDHFVKYGMKEGRQGSEEFNLEVYKYNGADLRAVYKDDNAAYYMHYIKYGKAEGRNAKTKEQQAASTVYNGTDYAAVYNYEYYRTNNVDLQKIFGEDSAKYLEHFVKYGMKEGRQGSEEFNLDIYKSNYADLSAAFKTNNAAYYMHYIQYGKPEGRNAKTKEQQKPSTVYNGMDYAAVYNYEYYRTNNTDLQKIFGEDSAKYLEHFVKYGMKEGRQGSEEFNLDIYKSNYADLSAAFKTNNAAYYMHYIQYGKPEGRNARTLIQNEDEKAVAVFDANGGYFVQEDGSHTTVMTQEPSELGKITFGQAPEIADAHLIFAGWYTNKEGSGQKVSDYRLFIDKKVTFYAKWEAAYTITYDANGGYFDGDVKNTKRSSKAAKDTRICLVHHYDSIDRESWKLFGWSLDPEGKQSVNIFSNMEVTSDMTLYAQWSYDEQYKVTFDAGEGYFSDGSHMQIELVSKENGRMPWLSETPEIDDDTRMFDAWYTEKDGKGNQIRPGQDKVKESVTIYANWKPAVVITYDANGGEINSESSVSQKRAVGATIGWPLGSVGRDGYYLAGWYLDKECTEPLSDTKATENRTVYAGWIKDETVYHTVVLNANGGYFKSEYPYFEPETEIKEIQVADASSLYIYEPAHKDSSLAFDGWYLEPECINKVEEYTNNRITVTKDITCYAKWVPGYVVTFDGNGVDFDPNYFNVGTLTYYPSISISVKPGKAIGQWTIGDLGSQGYSFGGWYMDPQCTKPVDFEKPITSNVTYYAHWLKLVDVIYDSNSDHQFRWGGSTSYSSAMEGQEVEVSLDYIDSTGKYKVEGWYWDKECTKPVERFVANESVRLYAKWKRINLVTFDANGGEFWDETTTRQYSVETGKTIGSDKPESYLNVPESRIFKGWSLDPNATEGIKGDEITNYVISEDTVFYAVWEIRYSVTYDANGGYFWDEDTTTTKEWCTSGSLLSDIGTPWPSNGDRHKEFAGWYLEPECVNEVNADEYVVEKDVTLYVKWEERCIVTIDANGGYFWDDESVTTYEERYAAGSYMYGCAEPSNNDEHLAVVGWYLEPECINEVNFDEYVVENDVTIYAKWEERCIVTFDANGGYFWENESITTLKWKFVSGDLMNTYGYVSPSKGDEHVGFTGWYLEPECINQVNLNEYVVETDITLYAKWEERYIVTFDANGGHFWSEDTTTDRSWCAVGDLFENVGYSWPTNSDEHLEFVGWYFESGCINKVPNDYVVEADITVYARWEERCIITINANGGYFWDEETTVVVEKCAEDSLFENVGTPYPSNKDEHLEFAGWYFEPECINQVPNEYVVKSDITFYAKWEECYVITFSGNGRILAYDNYSYEVKAIKGSTVGEVPWVDDSTGEFAFCGWYFEPECINPVEGDVVNYIPDRDMTFYAKWSSAYTITFDANGGYFDYNENATIYQAHCVKGQSLLSVGYPELLNSDEHLRFGGWYLDSECTDSVDRYEYIPEGDITLYAKWETIDTQSLEESSTDEVETEVSEESTQEEILETQVMSEEESTSEIEASVESLEEVFETSERVEEASEIETFETSEAAEETTPASEEETIEVPETVEETSEKFAE